MNNNNQESYNSYNELVKYLRERKNKTFFGFLLRHREVIVTSSMSSPPNWLDLNNTWVTNFVRKAGRLQLNLSEKVFFFLFCKGSNCNIRRITENDNLITTPSSLF